jgi:hypothetical protein
MMANTEQLYRLVQLGEQVRKLARDLGQDSIAFMAGMVVAESRWAHYQSMEGEAPEAKIYPVGSGIHRHAQRGRWPEPHTTQADAASNVTQLFAYRNLQR